MADTTVVHGRYNQPDHPDRYKQSDRQPDRQLTNWPDQPDRYKQPDRQPTNQPDNQPADRQTDNQPDRYEQPDQISIHALFVNRTCSRQMKLLAPLQTEAKERNADIIRKDIEMASIEADKILADQVDIDIRIKVGGVTVLLCSGPYWIPVNASMSSSETLDELLHLISAASMARNLFASCYPQGLLPLLLLLPPKCRLGDVGN